MPRDWCELLESWADAANISSPNCGNGRLAVRKSCLLSRIVYGGEKGPSYTPCPVHKGKWSGIQWGWPRSIAYSMENGQRVEKPMDVEPLLQKWWDEGCRCATHKGANDTTGWQPDEHCGCIDG